MEALHGGNKGAMSRKDLKLNLQSSQDALREVLTELQAALQQTDEIEEDGGNVPVPSAELERMIAQCQSVARKLDSWQARL